MLCGGLLSLLLFCFRNFSISHACLIVIFISGGGSGGSNGEMLLMSVILRIVP